MLQKVDSKVLAAVALIIGLIFGFVADNTLLSKPRIKTLTELSTSQQEEISDLETQLGKLQNDNDGLQTQYDQLEKNAQENSEEQETQIGNLEVQLQAQNNVLNELQGEITVFEDVIDELEADYSKLQDKYDEVYNPLYIEFKENDLRINLTVSADYYVDNTPIQGAVIITHSDGTPFEGSFVLNLYKVHLNSGTTSEVYSIDEEKNYYWSSPFALGPGSYRLYLSELKDNTGNNAISNAVLRNYRLYVNMG